MSSSPAHWASASAAPRCERSIAFASAPAGGFRDAILTLAPSAAKASAHALPMPFEPPVTSTRFPARFKSIYLRNYANAEQRRRRPFALRGSGKRRADCFRARVRRRCAQLGAAAALLLAPLSLHRILRARLSAVGRSRQLRALFAGARARRHPRRARRAEDRARARRRPVDGRQRHVALRPHLSAARALAHLRRRRLRLVP